MSETQTVTPPPPERPPVSPGEEKQLATNPVAEALQSQADQAQASGEPKSIEDTLRDFANVDKGTPHPDEEAAIARAQQVLNPDTQAATLPAEQPAMEHTAEPANPSSENSTADNDDTSVEAQQKRLDDMMSKTPEELQKLAAEGNILAKRALSDMEKQISAGAEALNKQVAESGDQSVVEGQAQFTEPSADQRAQGETVQPPSPETVTSTEPVAEGAKTTEDEQDATAESDTDTELTPEQQRVQDRKDVIERVQTLAKLGIDINSESGQKVLDLIAENPQYASEYEAALLAAGANEQVGGPKAAAAAAEATANTLDEGIAKAQAEGDTETVKKLSFKKGLLIALAIALGTVVVAIGGAAAAGGVVGLGLAAAAAKGNKG